MTETTTPIGVLQSCRSHLASDIKRLEDSILKMGAEIEQTRAIIRAHKDAILRYDRALELIQGTSTKQEA